MHSEVAKRLSCLLLAAALGLAATAAADEWDRATDSDNGNSTDNAPAHGAEQIHDLGELPGFDQDWFRVHSRPLSSYQFVVDGMTGDLDLAADDVQRVDGAGGTFDTAVPSDGGGVLSLAWLNVVAPEDTFMRVRGAACGTACSAADRYRARFYDTTYTVPRFNNSGTQTTVLLIQNATDQPCSLRFAYLDSLGALVHTSGSELLGARALLVVNTSAVVPGQSGSVRILHLCGYGGLSGKAVSVEPLTGFAFDTPILHRPR